MDNQLKEFIEKAKSKGLNNEQIKEKLLAAGWSQEVVSASIDDDLVAPAPPSSHGGNDAPVPLTKREESVRLVMFEYNIMFLTLWIVAFAAVWIINAFLFTNDVSVIKFPMTALLVCLPIFLILFFRVRNQEAKDKELLHVSGRLRLIQSTQALAFFVVLVHTIIMVYQVLNGSDSVAKQIMSWLGTLVIFGGIFAYYWADTHQASKNR